MIWKLLAGLAVAWMGWRLWHGWGGRLPGTPTPPPGPPPRPPMPYDEAEARALLGVGADAGEEEIRAAHRKLIADVHPDRGGSADLSRRVNAARDRLLKR